MATTKGEVEIFANKGLSTKFTVPNGTRPEIESAIAEMLRPDKGLVWEDDGEGIRTACISPNAVWRPRRRFFETDDEDSPLLIEDKSEAPAKDGGE